MITIEMLEKRLLSYQSNKRRLLAAEIDLANLELITRSEVIEGMNFESNLNERVQTSGHSDKTGNIAIDYRRVWESENVELRAAIRQERDALKCELDLLDACVGGLDEAQRSIVNDMYIHPLSWKSMSEKYGVSTSTLSRYRKQALEEILWVLQIMRTSEQIFALLPERGRPECAENSR